MRSGGFTPSTTGNEPAPSRGWSPSATAPAPAASPPSSGNVIDFGAGSVPPRRTTPLLETRHSSPSGATAGAVNGGQPAAVRGRRAAGEATVADAGLENARRTTAARTTSVVRDRTVSRGDILQRYRGTANAAGADAQAAPAAASAAPDANADRIAAARRSAAARGATGAGADAPTRSSTGAGADAPSRAATSADAAPTRSATPPTDAESVAARVAAGRKDFLASVDARKADARRDAAAATAGSGAGGVGGVATVGAVPAVTTGPYGGGPYTCGTPYNGYCHDGCNYDYGYCYWDCWGGYCGFPCSWWLFAPFYTCGYWWSSYWYCGGYWDPYYYPSYYWYGPFLPYGYSVIVQSEPEVVYIESEPEVVQEAPAGEAVVPPAQPSSDGGLNRAADYYLALGDRAFREARYGDAVHYYAKAIEFSPDDGILHLVLADALFATGDYRYAAYALRTAFEKDPALAANVVDKRSFYANPADFDTQLALLERYLEDHFLDDDARLVLAANYLFGGRPIDTVKLLESPFSESLRATPAGQLMLDAARQLKDRPAAK